MAQHSITREDTMPVEIARSPNDKKIYISDLAEGVQEDELLAVCATYGKVKNIWVATGSPKCAFVEFHRSKDAADIVSDLNGEIFCGRELRVELYTKKKTPSAGDKKRRSRKDDGSRRTPVQYRKHRKLSSSSSNKSSKSPSTYNPLSKNTLQTYSVSPQPPEEKFYSLKSSGSQWSPIDGLYPAKEEKGLKKRKRPPSPPYESEIIYKRAKSRPRLNSPFSPPSLPPYETERTYIRAKSKPRLRSPFSPPSYSPPKRNYSTKAESPFSRRYDGASPSEYGVRPYTPSSCSGSCCRDKQFMESQYADGYYQGSSPSIPAYERSSHKLRRSLSRTSPDSTQARDDGYQRGGGFGTRRPRARYRGGSIRGFHSESHHGDNDSTDKWSSKPPGSRGFTRGRGRGRGRGFKPRGEGGWDSRQADSSSKTWNSNKSWEDDWDSMDKKKTQSPRQAAATFDEEDWDSMDKNKTQTSRQAPVTNDEEDWDKEDTSKASNTMVKAQGEDTWDSPKSNNQNTQKAATNWDEDWGSMDKKKPQSQRQPIATYNEDDWDSIDVNKSSTTNTKSNVEDNWDSRQENKNKENEDWTVMDKNKLTRPGQQTNNFDDDDWDKFDTNKPSNMGNKTSGHDEMNWDCKDTNIRPISKPATDFEEENWDCVDIKPVNSATDPFEENWDCPSTAKSTISRQPIRNAKVEINSRLAISPDDNEWECIKSDKQKSRKKAAIPQRYTNQISDEENWDSDGGNKPMPSQDVKSEKKPERGNSLAKSSNDKKIKYPRNSEEDWDDVNANASNQSYHIGSSLKSSAVDFVSTQKTDKKAVKCDEENWDCIDVPKTSKPPVWSDEENWDGDCPKKTSMPVTVNSSNDTNFTREKSSNFEASATNIDEYNWEPIAIQKPAAAKKTQAYEDEEDWDSPQTPNEPTSIKQQTSRLKDTEHNWPTRRETESPITTISKATEDEFNWECVDFKKSTKPPAACSDEEDWDRPASAKPANLRTSYDNYKTNDWETRQNYKGDYDRPVHNVPTSSNKFRADKTAGWDEKRGNADWDTTATNRPFSSKKPRGGYKSNEWDRNKSKSTKSLSTYEEPDWDSNYNTCKNFKSNKSYDNKQHGKRYSGFEATKSANVYSQDDWDYGGSNRPPSPKSPPAHHNFNRKWEEVSHSSMRPGEEDWHSARSTSRTRSVASYETYDSDSRRSYTPNPRKSSTLYDESSRNVKGSSNPFSYKEPSGSDRMKPDTYKPAWKTNKRFSKDDWDNASSSNLKNSSQCYNEESTRRTYASYPQQTQICSEENWDTIDVTKPYPKQFERKDEECSWNRIEANKPSSGRKPAAATIDEENWDSDDNRQPTKQINIDHWDRVDTYDGQKSNPTKKLNSTNHEKTKIQHNWDSDQDSNGANERVDNDEENWEDSDTKKTPSPTFSPASNLQSSPSGQLDLATRLADDDWEANDLNFDAIVSEIAGAISDDDLNFLEDETSVESPPRNTDEVVTENVENKQECASVSMEPTVINQGNPTDSDRDYKQHTDDAQSDPRSLPNNREDNESKLNNSKDSTHSESKSLNGSQDCKSRSKYKPSEAEEYSRRESREKSIGLTTTSDHEDCVKTSENRCDTANSVKTGTTPDDGDWD